MGLPYAAHCHLQPLLSNTLPIFNEVCRRSAKFILSCLCSGQHSFVQLQIMAYLLVLTRLLVVMLCFYVTVFISQQLISNLARLPI